MSPRHGRYTAAGYALNCSFVSFVREGRPAEGRQTGHRLHLIEGSASRSLFLLSEFKHTVGTPLAVPPLAEKAKKIGTVQPCCVWSNRSALCNCEHKKYFFLQAKVFLYRARPLASSSSVSLCFFMEPITSCPIKMKRLRNCLPCRACPTGKQAGQAAHSFFPKSKTFVDRDDRSNRRNSITNVLCYNKFRLKHKLSTQTESRKAVVRMSTPQLSGEVFKEPFLDILLTDLEQTAFSLNLDNGYNPPSANLFAEGGASTQRSSDSTSANSALPRQVLPFRPLSRATLRPLNYILRTDRNESDQDSRDSKRINSEWAPVKLHVKIGDYVHSGDTVGESRGERLIVRTSGRIVRISGSQIVVQRTQPVLYYSQARAHVKERDWVERNTPILTLTHQTLVTGDIVQGIPRIEQLFEAVHSPSVGAGEKSHFQETLHSQMREIFRQNWGKAALPAAVRQSLEQIQQILVESIQKVYLLQGVLIADKHIEIIVRQMTCKAQVLDSGDTGLLLGELLPVQQIENANLTAPGKKALYAPAVVGLTRSALESDSFLSAASFQESTRVLSRHALIGKSDLVRGLKEKVVIGDLISAGTGLDIYFVYTLLSPDQSFSGVPTEREGGAEQFNRSQVKQK